MRNMKKFIKLIKYDIKMGYISNLTKLAIFEILCICICAIGRNTISDCEINGIKASVGDYFCFVLGGPKHIMDNDLSTYVIPVLWLVIQVMIAYASGYYMVKDLHRYGQQVLIRSKSRNKWWISKCIWNILTVISMYLMVNITIITVAILSGAKMSMKLTPEIVMSVCNINMLNGTFKEEMIILLLMPVLVSVTLCMLQVAIAIITSPIIGFIVTQSIVFLSTIFEYKFLISNYGMLSHNRISCGSKIVYSDGIIICMAVFLVSWITGYLYFGRCNIISKGNEDV